MQELLAPLQTAFSLGLQYPPLATAATAAIERWETEQPQALRAVAAEIVPLLDPYLLEMADLASDSRVAEVSKGRAYICCWRLLQSVACYTHWCMSSLPMLSRSRLLHVCYSGFGFCMYVTVVSEPNMLCCNIRTTERTPVHHHIKLSFDSN